MNLRCPHIVAIGGTTRPGSAATMAQGVMQFALMQQYAAAARVSEVDCAA